ncbi:MAG: hypothetical protein LBK43_08040 [Treponema sp.]|jgi:hypothetical protein|nr:hypothetical protein [Treponema sp.]
MADEVQIKPEQKTDAVSISIKSFDGSGFSLSYHTLHNNNPSKNNNYVAVWSSDNGTVDPGCAPLVSSLVESSETNGSIYVACELREGSYVVGYSQVGEPKAGAVNLSATCAIPVASPPNDDGASGITMSIDSIGNAYRIQYQAVPNMDCGTNGNWIGIWKKDDVLTVANLYIKPIEKASSGGTLVLNDAPFVRGTAYQAGFFMSGYNNGKPNDAALNTVAAILSFATD